MRPASESRSDRAAGVALMKIHAQLSRSRRRELLALLLLMLAGAVAELGTIGAVVPFLALLSSGSAGSLPRLARVLAVIGNGLPVAPIAAAAIVFGAFALASGGIRIAVVWLTERFGFRLAHELAVKSQERILEQPYSFHIARNSSELIGAASKAEVIAYDVALPLIQSLIAVCTAGLVVVGLLFIQPWATIAAAVAFCGLYLAISVMTRRRLRANSIILATAFDSRTKVLQESLGGVRDVILDGSAQQQLGLFQDADLRLGRARATTNVIAQAPRFLVESLGIVILIAITLLLMQQQRRIGVVLPTLGALALGAQRLLPMVQTIYSGWSVAIAHASIVDQVLATLQLPVRPRQADGPLLDVAREIRVERVSFTYPGRNRPAIERVSLTIKRGAMVAIAGETGSGKSTLADILMGLLEPIEGAVLIDDVVLTPANARGWQAVLAHVPQTIFLADQSIARNIAQAYGTDEPDRERVAAAARLAHLDNFVDSLPAAYDTLVGERGVRLSGGQRQRLGLARALYKGAPVLVLDEVTSALDPETEAGIMETLDALRRSDRTIIIIGHSPSMTRHCDWILRLANGRVRTERDARGAEAPAMKQR